MTTIPQYAERNRWAIDAPGLILQQLYFHKEKKKTFTMVHQQRKNTHEQSPKQVFRNTIIKSRVLRLTYLFRVMYMCDRKSV